VWCRIAGLHPQSPRHFAWQTSLLVSQPYGPPTSVTGLQLLRKQTNTGKSTALTAEIHWSTRHLPLSTRPTCAISLGLLNVPAPRPWDLVELILLYTSFTQMPSRRSKGKLYVKGIGQENVDCVHSTVPDKDQWRFRLYTHLVSIKYKKFLRW
jgi:hypothetical protein